MQIFRKKKILVIKSHPLEIQQDYCREQSSIACEKGVREREGMEGEREKEKEGRREGEREYVREFEVKDMKLNVILRREAQSLALT